MSDEEAGSLLEAFKAKWESIVRGSVPVTVHILPGEEAKDIETLRRRRECNAQWSWHVDATP